MEKYSKSLPKEAGSSLTEKELIDYTQVQERVLFKLREQFYIETKYPYSVVETKADRLLKEYKGSHSDPKEFTPMLTLPKPRTRNGNFGGPSRTEAQNIVKAVPQNREEFVPRTQSFSRRWREIELPIGLSTRNPSTEVHPPRSSRSSVTTMDSLPSEVSSGFYDQYSVNKYWQDGIYQKSIQPHFFFRKHVAGNYSYKPLTMNKKLVRPWPLKKNTAQDSFFKSRPRSPLRITQPGREDCSAFSTTESRDQFLASLSTCPIICDELNDEKVVGDEVENYPPSVPDPIPPLPSSSSHTVLESSIDSTDEDETETPVLTENPEDNNNNNIDIVGNEVVGILESSCSEEEVTQDIPLPIQISTFPLALALIPLPWHIPALVIPGGNNRIEPENYTVSTIPNPILESSKKRKAEENKVEEIKPVVRKARGICSIVRTPVSAITPTTNTNKDPNCGSISNGSASLGEEKLTPKQSRLMMEIDQILSRRTNSNFQSTSSSRTESSIPSTDVLHSKALEERKTGQQPSNEGSKYKKAILLPSEKQMLSRLSGIFKRLDYDNSNNVVPPKLKKNTVSKSKTNARVPSLPKWPEWKFDISLFPKAENLIAEAKELVSSSDNEGTNYQEKGTEFVIGMGNVPGNKLWEQSSNTSAFPEWFRKIPKSKEGRTLTSSNAAKGKDDLHPRKFTERKPGSQNEKSPEILKDRPGSKFPKLMALSRRATIGINTGKLSSGSSLDIITGKTKQEEKSNPKVQMKRKMLLKKLSATSH